MDKDKVGELEALLAKATPGPWAFVGTTPSRNEYAGNKGLNLGGFVGADGKEICHFGDSTTYYPDEGSPPSDVDAALIVAAVNTLPELLRIYRAWQGAAVVEVTECNQIPGASDFDFGDMLAAMQAFPIGTRIRLVPDDGDDHAQGGA